jgi:hypothetical protein
MSARPVDRRFFADLHPPWTLQGLNAVRPLAEAPSSAGAIEVEAKVIRPKCPCYWALDI